MADISMIRGDTKVLLLTPYRDDEPIELAEGDVLHFRLFDNGNVVVSKDVTAAEQDGDTYAISVVITAADTQEFDIDKDTTYSWEGEIEFADGTILTPFYNEKITIKPDKITPDKRGDA